MSLRPSTRALALAVAAMLVTSRPAAAQQSVAGRPNPSAFGVSIGIPGADGFAAPELFTVGVNWTQLQPARPGADLAMGTMPYVVSLGAVVLGLRAGVAIPMAVTPNLLFLPSAGLSIIGGGDTVTPGLHAGLAAMALNDAGDGVRVGVTLHQFATIQAPVWLAEVGMVHRSF